MRSAAPELTTTRARTRMDVCFILIKMVVEKDQYSTAVVNEW